MMAMTMTSAQPKQKLIQYRWSGTKNMTYACLHGPETTRSDDLVAQHGPRHGARHVIIIPPILRSEV